MSATTAASAAPAAVKLAASAASAVSASASAVALRQNLISIVKSSPNLGVGTVVTRWPRLTRQCFVITAVRPRKGEDSHPAIYGVYSPPPRGKDSLPVTRGERVNGPLKKDWLVVQPTSAEVFEGQLPVVSRSAQRLELGGELRDKAHSLRGPYNPNRLRRVMYKLFQADPRYQSLLAAREREALLRARAARVATSVRRVGKNKFVACGECGKDFKAGPEFFAEEGWEDKLVGPLGFCEGCSGKGKEGARAPATAAEAAGGEAAAGAAPPAALPPAAMPPAAEEAKLA